jgi:uncharacterized membrane protein YsdA (DUF1294 family)/cold shock CspA family protein
MRYQGKITHWKDNRGFGFITPSDGGKQVFVHIRSFTTPQRRPVENEIVTYELKTDDKGRAYAESVAYELKTDAKGRAHAESVAFGDERVPEATSSTYSNAPLLLAATFLVFVAVSALADRLPFTVLGVYFCASIIAFFAYALDKSAATTGQWRTQESTLNFFALIGGWPGALAAQRLLRHKSRKQSFQFQFWFTVVINCSFLGFLYEFS